MRPLLVVKTLNAALRRRFLYPVRRWMTSEHIAALMLLLYALSLFFGGSPAFVALGRALSFWALPSVLGVACIVCVVVLLSGKLTEREYHIAILPMLGYASVSWWAWARQPVTPTLQVFTFGSALFMTALWLLFYIAGVTLPPEGDDHDRTP